MSTPSLARGRVKLWAGRVISALPVIALLLSAAMKLTSSPEVTQMFTGKLGYMESTLLPIGVIEILCAVLYAVPLTSAFGAILITGYLGGAIATHVRVGDPFVVPLLLGVLAWVGLYLRDSRIRALIPLRNPEASRPL